MFIAYIHRLYLFLHLRCRARFFAPLWHHDVGDAMEQMTEFDQGGSSSVVYVSVSEAVAQNFRTKALVLNGHISIMQGTSQRVNEFLLTDLMIAMALNLFEDHLDLLMNAMDVSNEMLQREGHCRPASSHRVEP